MGSDLWLDFPWVEFWALGLGLGFILGAYCLVFLKSGASSCILLSMTQCFFASIIISEALSDLDPKPWPFKVDRKRLGLPACSHF